MNLKPIKSELDYEKALVEHRKLRKANKGTDEYNLREVLKVLIINYERVHYPFGQDNFDEWIKKLENNDYTDKKLSEIKKAETFVERAMKFKQERVKLIKERLKKRNLKQQYLAEIIGVDKSYVSQLMNGKKGFTVTIISKLNHHLNIPFEKLIPPYEFVDNKDQLRGEKKVL